MDFYISGVSVHHSPMFFGLFKPASEIVSLAVSVSGQRPELYSSREFHAGRLTKKARKNVLESLREDHCIPDWDLIDFKYHKCMSKEDIKSLLVSFISSRVEGNDRIFMLFPEKGWHLIKDLYNGDVPFDYIPRYSVNQLLNMAIDKEKLENLDKITPSNLRKHKNFPKLEPTSSCLRIQNYTIELHNFLKRYI